MIGIVSGVKVYNRPGKTGFARAFHVGIGRGTFNLEGKPRSKSMILRTTKS